MRLLKEAGTNLIAALFGAEQLLLDAFGFHARRADNDKRRRCAVRPIVQQPRSHFLADTGRASDQNPAAGTGNTFERRADSVNRARNAVKLVVAAAAGF